MFSNISPVFLLHQFENKRAFGIVSNCPCYASLMGKKDIISKEAIKRIAVDLATILLELDIDPDSLELLETEKQRIEDRQADLVARVQDAKTGEPYLLHIEIQNNNDTRMPHRMLRYYNDIRLSGFEEILRQYLIYIGKERLTMPDGIDELGVRYQYQILDMRQIDCESLLQQDSPDALVLAILCDFKNRPAKDVVHYIVTRLKTLLKDDESGFRRYIGMLEILSENRELQETIKEVEKMLTQVDIKKLPSYQLGLEQGLEEGREEGIEKGLEEGIERGLEEGKLQVARNLLDILSDEKIAHTTGLSLEAVLKLRAEKSRNN